MFNAIGNGFGAVSNNYGGQQGFRPGRMMMMRQMMQSGGEGGSPFADQIKARIQESGFHPMQAMMTALRSQNSGQFPGANLSEDQRNEVRNLMQNARADGQVTTEERRELFSTLRSFRQESGGGWSGPFGGGGGGPFGGNSPFQMIAQRFGGGY